MHTLIKCVPLLVLGVLTEATAGERDAGSTPVSTPTQERRAASTAEIVRRTSSAVVSLRTFDADGRAVGLGSGFLIDEGRVVTNAHVIQGAIRVEVFDADANLLGGSDFAEALSSTTDIAVLPAMPNPPAQLQLSEEEPAVGDEIIVIGSPQGLTNTVSTGIVSAFRDNEGTRWMQISAPISQGSSGGPVLDKRGEVVGVSVAVLREGQNLNFAVPVRNVRAVVGSPRGRISFGAAQTERPREKGAAETKEAPRAAREIPTKDLYRAFTRLSAGEVTAAAGARAVCR